LKIKIAYTLSLVLIFGLLPAFTMTAVSTTAEPVLIYEVPTSPAGTDV
jgi:hypothetical protein